MYRNKAQRDFARQLRNEATSPEKRLWHFLRAQNLKGHKFRRQAAIDNYVVDFVCFPSKLIIELDGPKHLEPDAVAHDLQRTDWLRLRGFRVIRFRNQELDENIHVVVDAIEKALNESNKVAHNPPSPTLPAEGREPEDYKG